MKSKSENIMVKDFNRIIAPIDGSKESKKAAQKALSLAKKTGKEFVAMYVVDTPRLTQTIPPNEASVAWESILKKQGHSVLDEIEKKGKKIGVRVVKKLVEGIPEEEIVNEAKKNDIIVLACEKKNIFDKLLIGSVCEEVIQKSSSEVIVYQMKK
jgi:nucleotide-binding universal stress UspA family protein